jgi:hypothetical protein
LVKGSIAVVVAAALLLVLGIAVNRSGTGTEGSTDGSAFEGVARLMSYDCTGRRSEESAGNSAALGVGAGGFGTVGEGNGAEAGNDKQC